MRVFNPTTSLDQIGDRRHHLLTELLDDDHTQYLNTTRHDILARHPATILDPAISEWYKIAEVIPTSNVDYVDFTGLDINTDKFYVLLLTIGNPTANDSYYRLCVEGDYTVTNYYTVCLYSYYGTVVGAGHNEAFITFAKAGLDCFAIVWITRDVTGRYRAVCLEQDWRTTTFRVGIRAVYREATIANLTSLRFFTTISGAIGAGSILTLFRVRR